MALVESLTKIARAHLTLHSSSLGEASQSHQGSLRAVVQYLGAVQLVCRSGPRIHGLSSIPGVNLWSYLFWVCARSHWGPGRRLDWRPLSTKPFPSRCKILGRETNCWLHGCASFEIRPDAVHEHTNN